MLDLTKLSSLYRQHQIGVRVGERILLLISHREKLYKRDIRILPILSFLSQTCWKFMFGHPGDLYKSSDAENDCESHSFRELKMPP